MPLAFNADIFVGSDSLPWMAGYSVEVLAKNFGQPAELIKKFSRKDVFITPQ